MLHFMKMRSLVDVVEMLWEEGSGCLVMAGGTDLLVRPNPFAGKHILLDITGVEELAGIGRDQDGAVRVGAAATHQQVADNRMLSRRAHLLGLACRSIGSYQIRNRGTLGGNLGNASPAGDSLPALACLDARIEVASKDHRRTLKVVDLFVGPGKLSLQPNELIVSARIPLRTGRSVAFYKKIGQRKGMSCSKASVAFCARRHADGRLSEVRVALGAVAPTVILVPGAQQILEGQILTPALILEAARFCSRSTRAIDDIRSTARYRRQVIGALMTEGLFEVLDHIRGFERKDLWKPKPKP